MLQTEDHVRSWRSVSSTSISLQGAATSVTRNWEPFSNNSQPCREHSVVRESRTLSLFATCVDKGRDLCIFVG